MLGNQTEPFIVNNNLVYVCGSLTNGGLPRSQQLEEPQNVSSEGLP